MQTSPNEIYRRTFHSVSSSYNLYSQCKLIFFVFFVRSKKPVHSYIVRRIRVDKRKRKKNLSILVGVRLLDFFTLLFILSFIYNLFIITVFIISLFVFSLFLSEGFTLRSSAVFGIKNVDCYRRDTYSLLSRILMLSTYACVNAWFENRHWFQRSPAALCMYKECTSTFGNEETTKSKRGNYGHHCYHIFLPTFNTRKLFMWRKGPVNYLVFNYLWLL